MGTAPVSQKLNPNAYEGCSIHLVIAEHQDGEGGRCLMADV